MKAYGPVPSVHGYFPTLPLPAHLAALGLGAAVPNRVEVRQGPSRAGIDRIAQIRDSIPRRRIRARSAHPVFGKAVYLLSCGHARVMIKHTRPIVPCAECPRGSESDE